MIKITIQFSNTKERETAKNIMKSLNRIPGILASTEYNTMIEA